MLIPTLKGTRLWFVASWPRLSMAIFVCSNEIVAEDYDDHLAGQTPGREIQRALNISRVTIYHCLHKAQRGGLRRRTVDAHSPGGVCTPTSKGCWPLQLGSRRQIYGAKNSGRATVATP